jgi:acyl-CoA thioester hydrolase
METYSNTYEIRWTDLDANGHMRYAAYIDATMDQRYRFFAEHGFPPEAFLKLGLGLIYTALSAQFLREVRLGETLTITYLLAGLSPRGMRWKVQHDLFKANGKKAVVISIEGAILDLNTRKPTLPPAELLSMIQLLARASEFEEMSESRWLK